MPLATEHKPFVLFLPKWYPDRNRGHDGIFVKRHAQAVLPYAQVVVLYPVYDHKPQSKWLDYDWQTEDGIPTLRIYYKKTITGIAAIDKLIKLFVYFFCVAKGYQMIVTRFGKPDLVHAHILLRTGMAAYCLKLIYKIPYLITEHWSGYLNHDGAYGLKSNWLQWCYRFVVKRAAALTSVSSTHRDAMIGYGLINSHQVVPNVVDVHRFIPNPVLKPTDKLRFIHISSLDEVSKNILGLVRVCAQLAQSRIDFELIVVGGIDERPDVLALAKNLGILDRHIFFEGEKYGQNLISLLQSAHCLVLFSNYENAPCVLIEAFACGVPVIASETGGIPEIVQPDAGLLVEPGNEKALYEALQTMFQTYKSYQSQALRQEAIDKYSAEQVGKQFFSIYRSILAKKPKAFCVAAQLHRPNQHV